MPVEIHASHAPVELILRGEISLDDVDELLAAAQALRDRPVRPGLVIDASKASPTGVMWSQLRRDAMLAALQAVGCVAIVAIDAPTVHAAKVAFDPLGSEVVWRVFPDLESARIWVFSVERLAQSVWSKGGEPHFLEHRVARLDQVVRHPPVRGKTSFDAIAGERVVGLPLWLGAAAWLGPS
jgi:hypothetical protein